MSTKLFSSATEFVTGFFSKNKTQPPIPPELHSASRVPHGAFQFQMRVAIGVPYEIQASPDLQTWLPVANGTSATEMVDFVDSDAPKFNYRFYRAIAAETLTSRNVIGYATLSLPAGYSMIANPLSASNNSVAALFPTLPDGTTLSKFDTKLFRLTENVLNSGKWKMPSEMLVPGEGAILFNPKTDSLTLNFVGEVLQGNLLNPIPAGFSIRSSLVPQPGRLDVDLGFPLTDGDAIHIYDRYQQKYIIYAFPDKIWQSNPPLIGVGESFWVGKTSPGNWARNFVVAAAPAIRN